MSQTSSVGARGERTWPHRRVRALELRIHSMPSGGAASLNLQSGKRIEENSRLSVFVDSSVPSAVVILELAA